jgi:hypothetical protein
VGGDGTSPSQIAERQLRNRPDRFERKVIYASHSVDVAGNMELVRETVEICKVILEMTNWDIRLLSKSNLLPKVAEGLHMEAPLGEWLDGLGEQSEIGGWKHRVIYGVSTGTLDDGLARAFEAGTPLVSKRLQSLHWLQDNGFWTFGMVCPSLPQADYGKFAREMAAAIRADRCEHVWAEVINLRGESFTRTFRALEAAGMKDECDRLQSVTLCKKAWERYARETFEAHAEVYGGLKGPDGKPKLRFLQYVTPATRDWWAARQSKGAVLL